MKKILNIKRDQIKKIFLNFELFTKNCSIFSLVQREGMELNSPGLKFVNDLSPNLKSIEVQSSWPGTVLTEGHAKVYYYYLNHSSERILRNLNTFLDLMSPNYLEDICFYKNEEPFLVTISHEKELYFQASGNDLQELKIHLKNKDINYEESIFINI